MAVLIISFFIIVSLALTLTGEYKGPKILFYLCKPLTTVLILATAFLIGEREPDFYLYAVLAGLLFSLAGDVFLMLPRDLFIPGLISFLAAHICYIVAFSSETAFGFSVYAAIPLLLFGIIIYGYLARFLGKMKLPVVVYMAAILIMALQAWRRYDLLNDVQSLSAFLGALLFIASDSVLAVDRFRKRFKAAQGAILTTYFTAQWLIAISTGPWPFL